MDAYEEIARVGSIGLEKNGKNSVVAKAVPNSFDLDISGERKACAVPAFLVLARKVYSKEMKTKKTQSFNGF